MSPAAYPNPHTGDHRPRIPGRPPQARRSPVVFPEGVYPDGICLDVDGAIWVASTTTAECLRVVQGGEIVHRISTGERIPFTCAPGGEDGRTLFIATSLHMSPDDTRAHRDGRIEAVSVETAG
jgi:sugar lactone lactonase YvrE